MSKIEAALLLMALLFVIVFLVDYVCIIKKYITRKNGKSKKKKKNNELMEISYLTIKFDLDENRLPLNKLGIVIAIFNALIISVVIATLLLINLNVIIRMAIGFIMLLCLIYSLYELLGRYLVKKGYRKDGK